MTVEERIRRCILIEKMKEQKEYSQKLSLENRSSFHGKIIPWEVNKIC